MKKIKNILTVIGMTAILGIFYAANLHYTTTLDYLSAPKMWTEQTSSKDSYDFLQFTKTQYTKHYRIVLQIQLYHQPELRVLNQMYSLQDKQINH